MIKRDTLLNNVLHTIAGQGIAMVLGFATQVYLARILGVQHYGVLGFSITIISYFGILGALGTDAWASRAIAQSGAQVSTITGQIVSLRLALSCLSLIPLSLMLMIWDQPYLVNIVVIVQAMGLFVAATTLDFSFQGLEKLNIPAWRQITASALTLIGVLVFLKEGSSVISAVVIFQIATGIATVYSFYYFWRVIGTVKFKVQLYQWLSILRDSIPFAVTSIVVSIYFSIDIVIIGLLSGTSEVGLYVAAGKVFALGLAVVGVFNKVFFPILSRLMDDPKSRTKASGYYARTVIFICGIISICGLLLAHDILMILFGNSYIEAEIALRILMANLAIASIAEVYQLQMVSWKHEKEQMYIMITGAVANLLMNLIVIPRYGIEGAAATTMASTLLVIVLAYISLKRHERNLHHLVIFSNLLLFAIILLCAYLFGDFLSLSSGTIYIKFVSYSIIIIFLYCLFGWAMQIFKPIATFRYFRQDD